MCQVTRRSVWRMQEDIGSWAAVFQALSCARPCLLAEKKRKEEGKKRTRYTVFCICARDCIGVTVWSCVCCEVRFANVMTNACLIGFVSDPKLLPSDTPRLHMTYGISQGGLLWACDVDPHIHSHPSL